MTRDSKIGMLTGLGVIVLIGVLLSEYLGDPHAAMAGGTTASNSATGRMANLPVGESYRQQVLQPVAAAGGVGGVGSTGGIGEGMDNTQLAGGTEIVSPINTTNGVVPPAIYAVDRSTDRDPVIGGAVSPIAVGPTPADTRGLGKATANYDPPVIMLAESTHSVPLPGPLDNPFINRGHTTVAAADGMTYEIASGDSLGKIAKKFYNSSKNSDVQRIVAANPGMLKDANTTLVQGKKLVIPGVAPVPVSLKTAVPTNVQKVDPGVIHLPGDVKKPTPALEKAPKLDPAKKEISKVYQVQSGDTLEKIARKIAPSKTTETVQKLISMNGIKDPHGLQPGMKLKLPV